MDGSAGEQGASQGRRRNRWKVNRRVGLSTGAEEVEKDEDKGGLIRGHQGLFLNPMSSPVSCEMFCRVAADGETGESKKSLSESGPEKLKASKQEQTLQRTRADPKGNEDDCGRRVGLRMKTGLE